MRAFDLVATWPVDNVSAAVIDRHGEIHFHGDESQEFRLASVTKVIAAWATLVACEEGSDDRWRLGPGLATCVLVGHTPFDKLRASGQE